MTHKVGRLARRRCCAAATVVIAALCMAACASSPPRHPHPERWARAWIDSLNSHWWGQVGPLLGEDGVYEDPLSGGALRSEPAAFFWAGLWNRFPELRFQLEQVSGDGDVVAVEWTATGLAPTFPATRGIFILAVQGDALSSVRAYYNAIPFLYPLAP